MIASDTHKVGDLAREANQACGSKIEFHVGPAPPMRLIAIEAGDSGLSMTVVMTLRMAAPEQKGNGQVAAGGTGHIALELTLAIDSRVPWRRGPGEAPPSGSGRWRGMQQVRFGPAPIPRRVRTWV